MENKKVVILYNEISENASVDESDVLDQVNFVHSVLNKLNYEVYQLPFSIDINKFVDGIKKIEPAFVFNLVESLHNRGEYCHIAPMILDFLNIPFTGTRHEAMFITTHKLLTKKELERVGIPTSPWFTLKELHKLQPGEEYILKPLLEDGSLGLDEYSVFKGDDLQFIEKIKTHNHKKFFIEKFIHGREIQVSVLATPNGPIVLYSAEIVFWDYPDHKPKVFGYTAKWIEDSFEYNNTEFVYHPVDEADPLFKHIKEICLKCWHAFELHGYVRIDFRIDSQNTPYVLEINNNPCIGEFSFFINSAKKAGLQPEQVFENIINDINRI